MKAAYWKPWMTSLGLATVWIWFCLGSLYWTLLVVLSYFGVASKAADWTQAIGSVLAILAAGYFPIRHFELANKARQQSLLELIRVQTDQAAESIWLLTNCFVSPEHELARMREYCRDHRASDFEPLTSGLGQIPVAEIPPQRVHELGKIRNAVQLAASVAALLPKWIEEGSSRPDMLVALRGRRDLLCLLRARLPLPEGITDGKVDAQIRGEGHELFYEPFSIQGFKVFRRYFWYHVPADQFPCKAQVQLVPRFGDTHPITFYAESPSPRGWADIYNAERDVYAAAKNQIDARIEHDLMNTR
jgi:hypothetical protein